MDEESTSGSARIVAQDETRTSAAICSRLAAETFGLDVLSEDIHSDDGNETRFLVLRKRGEDSSRVERSADDRGFALVICHVNGTEDKTVIEKAVEATASHIHDYTTDEGKIWLYVFLSEESMSKLESRMKAVKQVLDAENIIFWDWGSWHGVTPT